MMWEEQVQKTIAEIAEQREEILRAFIAKYGCEPDEVEQVMRVSPWETIWFVRVREGGRR